MPGSPSRRRISHAITIAITALGLGLIAPTGAAVSTTSADALCVDAPADARVKKGVSGVDPNTVTLGESRSMNRQLRAKARQLAARGLVTQRGLPRGGHHKIVRIKTIVHVITAENGDGRLPRHQIRAQMKVINDGFRGTTSPDAATTNFRFVLKKINYVANDKWYDWPLKENLDETWIVKNAKKKLHRGGWSTLNVYVANLGSGLLGYATFPQGGKLKLDGLVVLNESLPGGSAAPYNEGDTATHEIGHWLGLFHTFEGGCEGPGDMVDDTPAQSEASSACDEAKDSCLAHPGTDPVHNFMDYSVDDCMNSFTPGQVARMQDNWLAYRTP
jgi:hypothetical protein